MRRAHRRQIWCISISVLILIGLVFVMLVNVIFIQGNARVVNYAGLVRGASQRLVKNELYGKTDDEEIFRLDSILWDLQNGGGQNRLARMRNQNYQQKLSKLQQEWETLKDLIYRYRGNPTLRDSLYQTSEEYFMLADDTVSAAEQYADGIASRLRMVELVTVADIMFILAFFIILVRREIHLKRRLRKIAYIDVNTGLPNKRSCTEKLAAKEILPDTSVTCCLMFDLNNLKTTNDLMGHESGDLLISNFASVLGRTAPAKMFVGRFGGDEFIGIMENTSRAEIERFLAELQKAVEQWNTGKKKNGSGISYACGYALSNEHKACTIKALMDFADHNMYQNKAEIKKNR